MLADLLKMLEGRKTYLAALGLAAAAFLKFRAGDFNGAVEALMGALAAFGIAQKVERVAAEWRAEPPPGAPPEAPNAM